MERTPTKRIRKPRTPYTPSSHQQSSPELGQQRRRLNRVQNKSHLRDKTNKKQSRKSPKQKVQIAATVPGETNTQDFLVQVQAVAVPSRLVEYSSSESDQEEDSLILNTDILDQPQDYEISQVENEWNNSETSFHAEDGDEKNLNTGTGPSFSEIGEFTTRSKKGFEIKVFDDYHFWFDKWDYSVPQKSYWCCKMKKYSKCRGRLIQDPDGSLRKGKFSHNHPPNDGEKEAMDWLVNARKLAKDKVNKF